MYIFIAFSNTTKDANIFYGIIILNNSEVKMKKTVIAIMLVLCVCSVCLVSCGPMDNNNSNKTPNNTLTPDNTPALTPDITPTLTPDMTTPIVTPDITPTLTPDISPVDPVPNR